jgi:hypothetical protein
LNPPIGPARTASIGDGGEGAMSTKNSKTLTEGQRAYEAKRAAKAGMSLEKWLHSKQRDQEAEARARQKAAEPPKPKKNTFFSRLLEKAQKPL